MPIVSNLFLSLPLPTSTRKLTHTHECTHQVRTRKRRVPCRRLWSSYTGWDSSHRRSSDQPPPWRSCYISHIGTARPRPWAGSCRMTSCCCSKSRSRCLWCSCRTCWHKKTVSNNRASVRLLYVLTLFDICRQYFTDLFNYWWGNPGGRIFAVGSVERETLSNAKALRWCLWRWEHCCFFSWNIHNLPVFQLATVYFRSVGHRLHECGVDSGAVQGRQLESNSDDDYADDRPWTHGMIMTTTLVTLSDSDGNIPNDDVP